MKSIFSLAKRNIKELIRDPLSLVFCIIFPIAMLILMQIITKNIEVIPENFNIENYAFGICVFGFTFTALMTAMSISGDKGSSIIKRIIVSPTGKVKYLLSFFVSGVPICLVQSMLFFIIALFFGLPLKWQTAVAFFYLIPSAFFFVSMGVVIGLISKNAQSAGPICSIITSVTGILGGVFMPLSAFSGGFAKVVNILPFGHSVSIASEIYVKGAGCISPHVFILLGYTVALWAIIVLLQKVKK